MLFIRLFTLIILSGISLSSFAGLCLVGQVKEVGTWVNPDTNTSGITKAILKRSAGMPPPLCATAIFAAPPRQ